MKYRTLGEFRVYKVKAGREHRVGTSSHWGVEEEEQNVCGCKN